eukprot:CAMPEP_0168247716 /NCGR_PEP_ID=MMETSP0141_2-20121125/1061_1 /TAXON_ID=44445 /ORGANISM="Pseudo-nitzschia australis, Strain 10249 10 AB" /LENGTH=289 /DNA_ID=CAMNT_0008183551 /DNA_START=30 /DNA_END=899 /DNA_ORIENTATION=-
MSSSPVLQILRRSKRKQRAATVPANKKQKIAHQDIHNEKYKDIFLNEEIMDANKQVRKKRQTLESSDEDSRSLAFAEFSPPSSMPTSSRSSSSNNGLESLSTGSNDSFHDNQLEDQTIEDFERDIIFSSKSPSSPIFSHSNILKRLSDSLDNIYDYFQDAKLEDLIERNIEREFRKCRRLVNGTETMKLSNISLYRLAKHSPNKSPIQAAKLRFTPVAKFPTTPMHDYQNRTTKLTDLTTTPMHEYQYQAPVAAVYPKTDSTRPKSSSNNWTRAIGHMREDVINPKRLL